MGDVLVAEEDIEDAIDGRGTQSDGMPGEGGADLVAAALEPDLASELNLSDQFALGVLDVRKSLGEASRGRSIARGGNIQVQSVVRALEVVDVAPVIEGVLRVGEVGEGTTSKQLVAEGAMEAFVFALSLRVVGTGVRDVDAQPDEPCGEGSEVVITLAAPGRAIVHGDALGQTLGPEDRRKPLLDGLGTLIAARLESQSEAGVIVEDGERMTAGCIGSEVALEVHLPELIGSGVLEALETAMLDRLLRVDAAVAYEDLMDGAGRRHALRTRVEQASAQFASAPSRMAIA